MSVLVRIQERHTRILQPFVYVRIVNDFANQINAPVGEFHGGLIRIIDSAIDAVTKAECIGETNREITEFADMTLRAHLFDECAVILRFEQRFDLLLEAEPAPEIGLVHVVMVTLERALLQTAGGCSVGAGAYYGTLSPAEFSLMCPRLADLTAAKSADHHPSAQKHLGSACRKRRCAINTPQKHLGSRG
jgi:hypothetical protein